MRSKFGRAERVIKLLLSELGRCGVGSCWGNEKYITKCLNNKITKIKRGAAHCATAKPILYANEAGRGLHNLSLFLLIWLYREHTHIFKHLFFEFLFTFLPQQFHLTSITSTPKVDLTPNSKVSTQIYITSYLKVPIWIIPQKNKNIWKKWKTSVS